MLKNFWYAIEWSDAIGQEPKRLTVLGQELVLYRNSKNEVVCMSDLCVHRGGALSDGWREGDCIVCPYHAWKYDDGGRCVRIPAAAPGSAVPKKARVDAYPTKEKYGWVWVFLGDLPEHERPPMPEFPEFDDPNFVKIRGEFMWDANYERVVENGVDATHVNWVHNFGDPERPEVKDFQIEIDEWYGRGTITLQPKPSKGLFARVYGESKKKRKVRPDVVTTTGWYMPSLVKIHIRLPFGNQIIYDTNVPIDENHTRTLWIGMRDFIKGSWANGDAKRRVLKIFKQDQKVVEAQRPELLPLDFAGELHHKTDALGVAYRKRRHELMDLGWGIDTHQIRRFGGKKATVIPSPMRRENPELSHAWVLKEVPTTVQKIARDEVELFEDEPVGD